MAAQARNVTEAGGANSGGRDGPSVVLVYHGISPAAKATGSRLLIDPAHLRSHVGYLRRRGCEFRTAEQLIAHADAGPPPGTAVLTFDDGWADAVTVVAPLLEELGVRATFYVSPGRWGAQQPDVDGEAGRLLSKGEAAGLAARGMELGSHSMTHPDLTKLDDAALRHELEASKAAVEQLTGRPCRTFAHPFGLYDARVARAAEDAGYELAFAWEPGEWQRFAAPRLPPPTRLGGWALGLKLRGIQKPRFLRR